MTLLGADRLSFPGTTQDFRREPYLCMGSQCPVVQIRRAAQQFRQHSGHRRRRGLTRLEAQPIRTAARSNQKSS